MRTILVAFDGSPPARRALRLASEIAHAMGARLNLVHVVTPAKVPPDMQTASAELDRENRKYGEQLLRDAARKARPEPVKTTVLVGAAAETLAEAALAPGVDLVVIGSNARRGVSRLLLGSVSGKLVHLCEKPVLIVR